MEVRRRLLTIKDSVDASMQRYDDYMEQHERGLITAIKNNTCKTIMNRMAKTREKNGEKKQFYGGFNRLINNISHEKT